MRASFVGLLAGLVALVSGCFDPTISAVRCGPNNECPFGQVCGDDDICRDPGGSSGDPDAANVEDPDAAPAAFRRPISISGSNNALGDYQVEITLDTSDIIRDGKMRADCGDLRFDDGDGNELAYYLESGCDTTSTEVWVRVSSIPTSGTTIYARYDNPTLTSASDPDATFEWFDDFSTDSTARYGVMGQGWYNGFADTVQGAAVWSDIEVMGFSTGDNGMTLLELTGVSLRDVAVEMRVLGVTGYPAGHQAHIIVRAQSENDWYGGTASYQGSVVDHGGVERKTAGALTTVSNTSQRVPLNDFSRLIVEIAGDEMRVVVDGIEYTETLGNIDAPGSVLVGMSQLDGVIDDLVVRKHATLQPAATVGPEETL